MKDEEFDKKYPQWIGFRDGIRSMANYDGSVLDALDDFLAVVRKAKEDKEISTELCPDKWCYPCGKGLSESDLGHAYYGWMIWQILTATYGNWGTSIRGSWFEAEHYDEVIDILENIISGGEGDLHDGWEEE